MSIGEPPILWGPPLSFGDPPCPLGTPPSFGDPQMSPAWGPLTSHRAPLGGGTHPKCAPFGLPPNPSPSSPPHWGPPFQGPPAAPHLGSPGGGGVPSKISLQTPILGLPPPGAPGPFRGFLLPPRLLFLFSFLNSVGGVRVAPRGGPHPQGAGGGAAEVGAVFWGANSCFSFLSLFFPLFFSLFLWFFSSYFLYFSFLSSFEHYSPCSPPPRASGDPPAATPPAPPDPQPPGTLV